MHIIAHGAPGQVKFSSGEWSADALDEGATDLAAIGDTLRPDGTLLLWSCRTCEGSSGRTFVNGLSRATGTPVVAATNLVGSSALGGRWELEAQSRREAIPPPLTQAGMVGYAGVFSVTLTSTGKGERLAIFGRWAAGTPAGTYFVVFNNSGTLEIMGKFIVPVNVAGTFAISEPLPAGSYAVGSNTAGPGTITVYSGNWHPGDQVGGTWSLGSFNPAITATLNDTRNTTSNHSNLSGAVEC